MITHFRKKTLFLLLLVATVSALAFPASPFIDWNNTVDGSSSILVATSKGIPWRTKLTNGGVMFNPSRGVLTSDIEIVATLKGEKFNSGTAAILRSTKWPAQGDAYLIFANFFDGKDCQAFDDYSVVPLGHDFDTNILSGKSLDEQIHSLLQIRYRHLTNEIAHAQTEKERLDEYLKK